MAYRVPRCFICNKPIFKGPIPFDDDGDYHELCYEKYVKFLEPGKNLKEIREYIEVERKG